MTDTGRCNKEFIRNPNNCECECDKLCDVGDYLDYKSCKCRKKVSWYISWKMWWKYWWKENDL